MVESAGQHPDRTGGQARLVRGRVDAAGEARNDRIASRAEGRGEHVRHADAGKRCVARTHDRDCRHPGRRGDAGDRDQRRWRVHVAQHRRVVGLADGDQPGAHPFRQFHLRLCFRDAGNADRAQGAAARGKAGEGGEGGFSRAEPVDQFAEGRRADVLGADEAQPRKPLPVGKAGFGRLPGAHLPAPPMRDSVPDTSRAMLVRCFSSTSADISAKR